MKQMTEEDAQRVVGWEISALAHGGGAWWLSGKVIAYTDRPSLLVEEADGRRRLVSIGLFREWMTNSPNLVAE